MTQKETKSSVVDFDLQCPICGQKLCVWENEGYGVVRVAQCDHCEIRFIFPYHKTWAEIGKLMNRRINNDGTRNVGEHRV